MYSTTLTLQGTIFGVHLTSAIVWTDRARLRRMTGLTCPQFAGRRAAVEPSGLLYGGQMARIGGWTCGIGEAREDESCDGPQLQRVVVSQTNVVDTDGLQLADSREALIRCANHLALYELLERHHRCERMPRLLDLRFARLPPDRVGGARGLEGISTRLTDDDAARFYDGHGSTRPVRRRDHSPHLIQRRAAK